MTFEEKLLQRILQKNREHFFSEYQKKIKNGGTQHRLIVRIYRLWKNRWDDRSKVDEISDEIRKLVDIDPDYEVSEIQFLAYCFAKADIDLERGWRYLSNTCLRNKFLYRDLVATRKTYERMFKKVTPDIDFRDIFS